MGRAFESFDDLHRFYGYKTDRQARSEVQDTSTRLQGETPKSEDPARPTGRAFESFDDVYKYLGVDRNKKEQPPPEVVEPPKPDPDSSDLARGSVAAAIDQPSQAWVGIKGLVASALGNEEYALEQFAKWQEMEKEASRTSKSSDVFWKEGQLNPDLKTFDGFSDFTQFWTGYLATEAGKAILAGAAGAAIGGPLGGAVGGGASILNAVTKAAITKSARHLVEKKIAAKMAEKQLTRKVSEEAAKQEVAREIGRAVGAGTGIFMSNAGQEIGSIYNEAMDENKGQILTGWEMAKVVATGTAAALVETATDLLGASSALKAGKAVVKEGEKSALKTVMAEAFKGVLRESPTEGVQTLLERIGANKDLNTQEAWDDYINSMVIGAFGGGMFGTATGSFKAAFGGTEAPAGGTTPPGGTTPGTTQGEQAPAAEQTPAIVSPESVAGTVGLANRMEPAEYDAMLKTDEGIAAVAAIHATADEQTKNSIEAYADRQGKLEEVLAGSTNEEVVKKGQDVLNRAGDDIEDRFVSSLPAYLSTPLKTTGFKDPIEERRRQAEAVDRQRIDSIAQEDHDAGRPVPGDQVLRDLGIDPAVYNERRAAKLAEEATGQQQVTPDTADDFRIMADAANFLLSKDDAPETPPIDLKTKGKANIERAQEVANIAAMNIRAADPNSKFSKLAAVFGIRLFEYTAPTKMRNKGFAMKDRNAIVINDAVTEKGFAIFVVGHEIFHIFEGRHPKLAARLRSEIVSYLDQPSLSKVREDYAFNEIKDIESEIPADLMGRLFGDQKFWEFVGAQKDGKTIVQRVMEIVSDLIKQVSAVFTNATSGLGMRAGSAQALIQKSQLEKVYKAMSNALIALSKSAGKTGRGNIAEMTAGKTIAVIGTAGRGKEDTQHYTSATYNKMYADLLGRVSKEDTLISGGAAWADHLAVRAFLDGKVGGLKLRLPAPFKNGKFVGGYGTSGGTANYYHQNFSKQVGINSLAELSEAINRGADVSVEPEGSGFKAMFARNKKIASESSAMVAYTFGNNPKVPLDGGTKNTWDTAQYADKVHVPILKIGETPKEQVAPRKQAEPSSKQAIPPIKDNFGAEFGFARFDKNGYEVSSQGDKRFSALNAKLADGRTIEEAYQLDVKGYRQQGNDWRLGKGKPPLPPEVFGEEPVDLWKEYLALWKQWAKENPSLIQDLREQASKTNGVLTDKFASSPISQARALAEILNEKQATPPIKDNSLIFVGGAKPSAIGNVWIRGALSSLLPKTYSVVTDGKPVGAQAMLQAGKDKMGRSVVKDAYPGLAEVAIIFNSGLNRDTPSIRRMLDSAASSQIPAYEVMTNGEVIYHAPSAEPRAAPTEAKKVGQPKAEVLRAMSGADTALPRQGKMIAKALGKKKEKKEGEQEKQGYDDFDPNEPGPEVEARRAEEEREYLASGIRPERAISDAAILSEEVSKIIRRFDQIRARNVKARPEWALKRVTAVREKMRKEGFSPEQIEAVTGDAIEGLQNIIAGKLDENIVEQTPPIEGQTEDTGAGIPGTTAISRFIQDFKGRKLGLVDLTIGLSKGLRDGDWSFRDIATALRENDIPVSLETFGLLSQPFMRKTFAQWFVDHKDNPLLRNGWVASLYRVEQRLGDIGSIKTEIQNILENDPQAKAAYKRYVDGMQKWMTRQKERVGVYQGKFDDVQDAFPWALYNKFSLEQVRNPLSVKDPQARADLLTEFADPEGAWWSDIFSTVKARPDLMHNMLRALEPAERKEVLSRIKVKRVEEVREAKIVAASPAYARLYLARFLHPDVYNHYARALETARTNELESILQAAEELNRTTELAIANGQNVEQALIDQALIAIGKDVRLSSPVTLIWQKAASVEDNYDVKNEVDAATADVSAEDSAGQGQAADIAAPLLHRVAIGDNSQVAIGIDTAAEVQRILAENPGFPPIHVLGSSADLRADIRERLAQKLGPSFEAKGLFDPETGEMYIFTSMLSDAADAEFVIFHELGHYGFRGLMGAELDPFLMNQYRINPKVKRIVDEQYSDLPLVEAIEEAIMDLAAGTAIRSRERLETRRRILKTGSAAATPIPRWVSNIFDHQKQLLNIISDGQFEGASLDLLYGRLDQDYWPLVNEVGREKFVEANKAFKQLRDYVVGFRRSLSEAGRGIGRSTGNREAFSIVDPIWLDEFLSTGKRLTDDEVHDRGEGFYEEDRRELTHQYDVSLVQGYIKDPVGFLQRFSEIREKLSSLNRKQAKEAASPAQIERESVQDLTPFKALVAKVVSWLRKHGFNRVADWMDSTGDIELAGTIKAARDFVRSGAMSPFNGAPESLRLSRNDIYESSALKDDKVVGYARYNPIAGKWIVYVARGDVLSQGWDTYIEDSLQNAKAILTKTGGKLTDRRRTPLYRANLTPDQTLKIPDMRPKAGTIRDYFRTAMIKAQNKYLPVLEVVRWLERQGRDPGLVWETLQLLPGRIKNVLDKSAAEDIDPLMEIVGEVGKKGGTVGNIQDFLLARHAEERNKKIARINPSRPDGGSGITTKEANDYLNDVLPTLPYREELERIGVIMDRISKNKLAYMRAKGLITARQFRLASGYQHYVTLSGVAGEPLDTDPISQEIGRGLNLRGTDIRRALGRFDKAENILERTIINYQSALVRGIKNEVAVEVMGLIEANRDDSFAQAEYVKMRQELDENGYVSLVEDWRDANDPNVMVAKINGFSYKFRFNSAQGREFVQALHGPEFRDNPLFENLGMVNNFVGRLITTYNPVWAVVNSIRDAQTAFFNAATTDGVGLEKATQMIKLMPKMMHLSLLMHTETGKGAAKGAKTSEWVKNQLARIPPEIKQYYKEWVEQGGRTAFIDRKSLEDTVRHLEDVVLNNKKNPILKIQDAMDLFADKYMIPTEEGPRLAAYVTMRRAGWTPQKAAVFSKELTVNFNMHGTAKWLRQSYLFVNPAIQGVERMRRGFFGEAGTPPTKRQRADAIRLAGFWFVGGLLMSMLSRGLFGDEDDDGQPDLDTIPFYKRATSIIIAPNTPLGAPVPLAYGWNWFYAVGHFFNDILYHGPKMAGVTMQRIGQSFVDAFIPNGGNVEVGQMEMLDWLKVFTPTPLVPMLELYNNKNRWGGPIQKMDLPHVDAETSHAYRHFRSVNPISEAITKGMLHATGGDRYNRGVIPAIADWNPGVIDHILSSYLPGALSEAYKGLGKTIRTVRGEDVGRTGWPVIDRFAAHTPESFNYGAFKRVAEEVETKYKQATTYPEKAQKILAENPGLGEAKNVVDGVRQRMRMIRAQMNKVENSDISAKEKIKLNNDVRAAEREMLKEAVKAMRQAGYTKEIISGQ